MLHPDQPGQLCLHLGSLSPKVHSTRAGASGVPKPDTEPVTTIASTKELATHPQVRRHPPLETDVELVAACRRGEIRAMEALYHQYKRRVFGLVGRIVGAGEAEEVAQDVFVRIFRGLPKFRGDAALGTWIYRLAVNAALTHATRRRRHAHAHAGDEVLADLPSAADAPRDPRLAARLEHALAQLPAGYRAILVLHDVEGLSHEECAHIMGCRVGTSKSQLHKARARMRELLGPSLAPGHAAAPSISEEP
jgi:RNA polymerase sigma-70 factor (ECF subfamily)